MILALVTLVSGGCYLFPGNQPVEIQLPEFPDSWHGGVEFIALKYSDEEGAVKWVKGLSPGELVEVTLPRGVPVPVLAYPHNRDKPPLPGVRPAGGIYPLDGGGIAPLNLTWREGFIAELLIRLPMHRRGIINLSLLRKRIEEVEPDDPWFIDGEKVRSSLVYGRFTSSLVKASPLYEWSLPSGTEGWWWGDPLLIDAIRKKNNLNKQTTTAVDEELPVPGSSISLYLGLHRLTSPDGTQSAIVSVDGAGWLAVFHPEGVVKSDRW